MIAQGIGTMTESGGTGDDVIEMYGGRGNKTWRYDLSTGNDLMTILGGTGYKILTVWKKAENFRICLHEMWACGYKGQKPL